METPTHTATPIASHDLFADLIRLHGEQNGGIEDFYVLDETTIGCRYGDCCIRLKEDGWHYGANAPAHPTPAQAFENRASDYHSANAGLSHGDESASPTAPTSNQSK